MKTRVLSILFALMLMLSFSMVTAGPAMGHTVSAPQVLDLLAGQDTDVGDVLVWNDGTTLYVKYETISGWQLAETHLAVATSLTGIPQTKTGNPIPGKFPYSTEHDPWVSEFTYPISLSSLAATAGTGLTIAAHAVVVNVGDPQSFNVISDTNDTVTQRRSGNAAGFTAVGAPAALAWEPFSDADPSFWDQNINYNFGLSGADWIWESYRVQDPVFGTVITLQKTFDIPGVPLSGQLHITADNGYEAVLNASPVGSAQVTSGWQASDLGEAWVQASSAGGNHWNTVEQWNVTSSLQSGQNALVIDAANEQMSAEDGEANGTIDSNPGGVIYELGVEWARVETAWADGSDFPGANWATYFDYTVQGINADWIIDVDFSGSHFVHDMTIATQLAGGNLSGTGGYVSTSLDPLPYEITWVLAGSSISGNSVTLTLDYDGSPYEATLTGTLAPGGESMSGNWTSNTAQSGTWTATRIP